MYTATIQAAARTGFTAHIPQLLVRFGFPGLMARLGVEPPVEADANLVRAQALHHTLLRECAEALDGALFSAGVRHVFAKGIALMGPIYRPGDRLLADIDMYVPRDEVPAAIRILTSLGYVQIPDEDQAGPPALRSTLAFERQGRTEMDSASVDLHWALDPVTRLLPRPDGDLPPVVWEDTESWGGLRVPGPELHAAILAHHLIDTDLLHVRSLLDLAFVFLRFPENGGQTYLRVCEELGIGPFAALLSHLLRDEFGVSRPSATGGYARGWNGFTRSLTLERWLAIVAQAPPDADDAITTARIRRRLLLVRGAAVPVLADALFPPRSFLEWRWRPLPVGRARWKHAWGLTRKLFGIAPAQEEEE